MHTNYCLQAARVQEIKCLPREFFDRLAFGEYTPAFCTSDLEVKGFLTFFCCFFFLCTLYFRFGTKADTFKKEAVQLCAKKYI